MTAAAGDMDVNSIRSLVVGPWGGRVENVPETGDWELFGSPASDRPSFWTHAIPVAHTVWVCAEKAMSLWMQKSTPGYTSPTIRSCSFRRIQFWF